MYYGYTNLGNSNRLLGSAGPLPKGCSHDAVGNVTGDGANSYGYDDRGRYTVYNGGVAGYGHNGLGHHNTISPSSATTPFRC